MLRDAHRDSSCDTQKRSSKQEDKEQDKRVEVQKIGVRRGIPEKAGSWVGASTGSWVGARAFDPTSLPSGSWNVTPAANGKKQKEKEKNRQKHAGTGKKNQRHEPWKETPAGPTRTGRTPDTKTVSLFVFVSDGCGVGALCSVLGSAPEGSALNPPPFQSKLELDPRTGGQRRSSPEPQMVARPQRWSYERF